MPIADKVLPFYKAWYESSDCEGAMTLTEKVYTHLDIEALVEAINEI